MTHVHDENRHPHVPSRYLCANVDVNSGRTPQLRFPWVPRHKAANSFPFVGPPPPRSPHPKKVEPRVAPAHCGTVRFFRVPGKTNRSGAQRRKCDPGTIKMERDHSWTTTFVVSIELEPGPAFFNAEVGTTEPCRAPGGNCQNTGAGCWFQRWGRHKKESQELPLEAQI